MTIIKYGAHLDNVRKHGATEKMLKKLAASFTKIVMPLINQHKFKCKH